MNVLFVGMCSKILNNGVGVSNHRSEYFLAQRLRLSCFKLRSRLMTWILTDVVTFYEPVLTTRNQLRRQNDVANTSLVAAVKLNCERSERLQRNCPPDGMHSTLPTIVHCLIAWFSVRLGASESVVKFLVSCSNMVTKPHVVCIWCPELYNNGGWDNNGSEVLSQFLFGQASVVMRVTKLIDFICCNASTVNSARMFTMFSNEAVCVFQLLHSITWLNVVVYRPLRLFNCSETRTRQYGEITLAWGILVYIHLSNGIVGEYLQS